MSEGAEFIPFLRKCDLFSRLSDQQLNSLLPGCLWVRLGQNETLFHEGSPGGSLYIVCSGELVIERVRFREDDRDDVVTLNVRRPYEVIGELSIFEDGLRTATVRSIGVRTTLLMVDGRYVSRCLEQSHEFALAMLKAVVAKLIQSMSRRSEVQTMPISIRLAKLLLDLADTCGKSGVNGAIELDARITQADLARRLGCSRETVNKELKALGSRTVSSARGKIRIGDREHIAYVAGLRY
jgi:CRP-like cAMP-binding protein